MCVAIIVLPHVCSGYYCTATRVFGLLLYWHTHTHTHTHTCLVYYCIAKHMCSVAVSFTVFFSVLPKYYRGETPKTNHLYVNSEIILCLPSCTKSHTLSPTIYKRHTYVTLRKFVCKNWLHYSGQLATSNGYVMCVPFRRNKWGVRMRSVPVCGSYRTESTVLHWCCMAANRYLSCHTNMVLLDVNPLNTKRRPLYLKTQFVPRSKHFSSRL